jgi:hypothetical protein
MPSSLNRIVFLGVMFSGVARRAVAFAPAAGRRAALGLPVVGTTTAHLRWMSSSDVEEKTEEEKAAVKAAREARK